MLDRNVLLQKINDEFSSTFIRLWTDECANLTEEGLNIQVKCSMPVIFFNDAIQIVDRLKRKGIIDASFVLTTEMLERASSGETLKFIIPIDKIKSINEIQEQEEIAKEMADRLKELDEERNKPKKKLNPFRSTVVEGREKIEEKQPAADSEFTIRFQALGKICFVIVKGTDTVGDLKREIYAATCISPENQRFIYKNGSDFNLFSVDDNTLINSLDLTGLPFFIVHSPISLNKSKSAITCNSPGLRTTQHVKIWFSLDRDVPLGEINETRISAHLENNRYDIIHLIVDKKSLSPLGIEKLHAFCERFPSQIKLLDLEMLEVELDEREKTLLSYAREELTHPYGNPAAASDLVRWFKAVLARGIYSDLDVQLVFNVQNEASEGEEENFLQRTVLLSIHPSEDNSVVVDNCIIALSDPNHPLVSAMQDHLLSCYDSSNGIYYAGPKEKLPQLAQKCFPTVFDLRKYLRENFSENIYMFDIIGRSGGITDPFRRLYCSVPGKRRNDHWFQCEEFNINILFRQGIVSIENSYDKSWLPSKCPSRKVTMAAASPEAEPERDIGATQKSTPTRDLEEKFSDAHEKTIDQIFGPGTAADLVKLTALAPENTKQVTLQLQKDVLNFAETSDEEGRKKAAQTLITTMCATNEASSEAVITTTPKINEAVKTSPPNNRFCQLWHKLRLKLAAVLIGAGLGAGLGSVIPGVGTTIGTVVGAGIVIGGIVGERIASKISGSNLDNKSPERTPRRR